MRVCWCGCPRLSPGPGSGPGAGGGGGWREEMGEEGRTRLCLCLPAARLRLSGRQGSAWPSLGLDPLGRAGAGLSTTYHWRQRGSWLGGAQCIHRDHHFLIGPRCHFSDFRSGRFPPAVCAGVPVAIFGRGRGREGGKRRVGRGRWEKVVWRVVQMPD